MCFMSFLAINNICCILWDAHSNAGVKGVCRSKNVWSVANMSTICRVYKNYDPRATIIKNVAQDVFKITGRNPLLDIAMELEKIARSDDYFVSRKLYPNVDFYSGEHHLLPFNNFQGMQ